MTCLVNFKQSCQLLRYLPCAWSCLTCFLKSRCCWPHIRESPKIRLCSGDHEAVCFAKGLLCSASIATTEGSNGVSAAQWSDDSGRVNIDSLSCHNTPRLVALFSTEESQDSWNRQNKGSLPVDCGILLGGLPEPVKVGLSTSQSHRAHTLG